MGPELQATSERVVERGHPGMTARFGSARPGTETAGWSGFLSAFIISLPTEGEKVFGAVRERAPDSMSRTRVTWHRDTCLYLLLLLLVVLGFFSVFFFLHVLLKKSGGTSVSGISDMRGKQKREEKYKVETAAFFAV